MKKYIITVCILILCFLGYEYISYNLGFYIDFNPNKKITSFVKTDEQFIYLNNEKFEIKGVNMGSGIPKEWSTDYEISYKTYMRWFKYIQEMGANTVRVYTVQNENFYKAFYNYNKNNDEPLYLIHGVWVNDYVQNSSVDAYDENFYDQFLKDTKTVVDVIHGNKTIPRNSNNSASFGSYRKDISPWVIGYIIGVEWEDVTVAYTDDKYNDNKKYKSYQGKYLYTTNDASVFETMLASVGDKMITYETKKYKTQRLLAFSNWPTTDPFDYSQSVATYFKKCANIDVEHIKTTDSFVAGQFASYHVYPYYPDYLSYETDWTNFGLKNKISFTENKELNTYKAYVTALNLHHNMPVLISEFGVSTGRGMAQKDKNTHRNQGNMSESEQGDALVRSYEDIIESGSAGGIVFSWQDEWFKRTWNTMYAVDLTRTPYWSDYQTNEQYFGLLSFDPGKVKSVSYVDGDTSEWNKNDIVYKNDGISLSMKYDEKFVYFMVNKKDFNEKVDKIYIPLDITPKSGATYSLNHKISFSSPVDFVIEINGKDNSRVWVQERYEALRSTYSENVYGYNTYFKEYIPKKDSESFTTIDMILQTATYLENMDINGKLKDLAETFETGHLTYGNANPESPDFNSLADFIFNDDYIEIKLPWQLLNFADPSRMKIHDDYYENYGVKYLKINHINVGVGTNNDENINLNKYDLKGWNNSATYHERLKKSYYILKEYWNN